MTKDEALKLALEALEEAWYHVGTFQPTEKAIDLYDEARTAIKEALAQPEHGWTPERIAGMARLKDAQDKRLAQPEQEPVAWVDDYNACKCPDNEARCFSDKVFRMMQKHTTPPQRTWVGLTEKDILEAAVKSQEGISPRNDTLRFAVAIEAKLKEKNNG